MKRHPQVLLPLTPAVFHILLSLAGGGRHGYGIMRAVAERTEGKVRLGPGTLYGFIKRMLESGRIAESERLARLVRSARAQNLLPGTSPAGVLPRPHGRLALPVMR